MAIYNENIVDIELTSGSIFRSFLSHSIGSGDALANRFGVRVFRNGEQENIGGTCMGLFIRADGTTVTIASGTVSGNVAYVTLPEACYAVEGQFALAIKCQGGGVTGTLRIVDGVVSRTSTSAVVDPGTLVPSIEDLIDAIEDAVESIPSDYSGMWTTFAPAFSTETAYKAGQYVTYDGKMYKFTTDHAAGTWNSAHVTQVNVGGETSDLKNAINNNENDITGLAESCEAVKQKNFFDKSVLVPVKYANNTVYTVDATGIVVKFTDSNNPANVAPLFVLKKGTYTISVTNACRIQLFADGTQVFDVQNSTSKTFTLANDSGIYVKFIASSYPFTLGNVQIEAGTEVTQYTKYESPVFNNFITTKTNGLINAERGINAFNMRVSDKFDNTGTVASGVLRYTDGAVVDVGYHSTLSVTPGDQIYFEGFCYGNAFPAVVMLYNGDVVNGVYKESSRKYYGNICVPYYVDTVVVNGNTADVIAAKVTNAGDSGEGLPVKQYVDNSKTNSLRGKKVVWFGTSIPAGGYIGADVSRNYPSFIAEKYECTVLNEAIGSSCAHCKEMNSINTGNPYGFNTDFVLSSRCLSNTHQDMQWLIDHYNDSIWTNKPASLTNEYKTQMMSFSYETKLDKYLTAETFPDLFVFDHGYNDYVSSADNYTGHEYEPYTLQGALNFLIRRIYSYRPDAKILIIGNYKYQTRNGLVVEAQKAVAQRWDIPMFDNWHHTGLSDEQAYCSFVWVQNGSTWEQQQSEQHLETLTNILLPDGVHPHSRPDNLIINRMANAIGRWIAVNTTFDN